jgi:hypothetical protein
MGQAAAVAMLGGSILGAQGQLQAGGYNAGVNERNAYIARLAAGDAMARGQVDAQRIALRGATVAASARAAAAGGGVDVQSGSVLDAIGGTRFISALDQQAVLNRASREAWGRDVEASQYEANASLARSEAGWGAFSTILGAGAKSGSILYESNSFPKFGRG